MTTKTFLITGCTSGFGAELVQHCLDKGDRIISTARNPAKLPSFKGASDKNYLAVRLDVTDHESIVTAFDEGLKKFGRIDVVVNNAGYGLCGPFESYTEKEMRQQMEINFFGLVDVTRIALETFRDKQKPQGGLIQQVTSIGGQRGVPHFSLYCASKWAVEGMTEALSHELKPEWNIKLNIIEPGGFRTLWANESSMQFSGKHPAYDHMDGRQTATSRDGKQAGDPKKGAQVMREFAVMDDPPLRVVIGTDAYKAITGKIEEYGQNYKKYESLSTSTNVDGFK